VSYSNSIRKRETPQYAYVLAIFSGGLTFMLPQLGVRPLAAWLSYALLGALFASIWPRRALQWAGWLCLPIVLLIWIDVVVKSSASALLSKGMIFAKAILFACLGAYLGSKLPLHRMANRSARRKALSSEKRVARNVLGLSERSDHAASVKTVFSGQGTGGPVPAAGPATRLRGLNAALIKAAQEGALDRVRLLVADGADVNAESTDQWTPFTIATGNDVEMVKNLFSQGTALDYSGSRGWTPLMIATIEGHTEVVRALLECGARANAENNKGWTALRFAVSMDETEIMRLLLGAGADANLTDHEGKTALMQAAGENTQESLKVLLEAGANPRLRDLSGRTALMIAQQQGYQEIIKLLKEAESEAESKVHITNNGDSKAADKTHRVIKRRRDQYYGLVDRYDVILSGAPLPYGYEETGRIGSEEECLDYAWKNSIDEPSELAWWLGFSS